MRKTLLIALMFICPTAYACGSNEYESCWSFCAVPKPLGGCALEAKDCKCLPKIDGDVGKAAEGAKDIIKETAKFGDNVLTTIAKAGGDTVVTLEKAGGDTFTTLTKAGGDTVNTVVKAGQDGLATYTKAWRDSSEQAKRSFQDTVDAGSAILNYGINQLKSWDTSIKAAEKRVREGKVVDAIWGLSVEPLQASEANFARATQESKLIATAAQSAASVYGGPGGAAAYAAWSVYRSTGDVDQAIRAGILSAATAQVGTPGAAMPSSTMSAAIKKAAVAGAAGGLAVAAAGGDEKAITEGFLKAGGAVLLQASADKVTSFSPKAKDAWDAVHCISARDVDCLSNTTWARDAKGRILTDADGKPRVDPRKLDPQTYIGHWSSFDPNSVEGKLSETYQKMSRLPKVEAIPLLKGQWVLTWSAGKDATNPLGQPLAVLTYVGTDRRFISDVVYGKALPLGSTFPTSYACTIGSSSRSIRVARKNAGCEAIYRRHDGSQQTVWHSKHFPDICAEKAAEFVSDIAQKGIKCTPN